MSGGLIVQDLRVAYGPRAVIDGLDLPALRAGEITVLAGPNAAGKSTLLRAIAQLAPYRGRITLDGTDLAQVPIERRAAMIGFMPQMLRAGTALTVVEGVIAALRAAGGVTGRQAEDRAFAVLGSLGLGDLAMRRLADLSGGQRQMVSLAQTMVREPQLLLLDEPTSALDLSHQTRLLRELRALAQQGRTVVVVLHDLTMAAQWADRMVILTRGGLYGVGTAEEMLTPAMLAEVYGVAARVERCSHGRLMVIVDEDRAAG